MKHLAILTSHPIPYQAPIFKALARKKVDLKVYFCWDFGVSEEKLDTEFGVKFKWEAPLTDGYKHQFLKNYSPRPQNSYWGLINPGIIAELIRNKPDLLFVHGWNSFTNIMAIITSVILNIPIGMHGDNNFHTEFAKSKTKIFLKKIILGILFKIPHFFFYMGEEDYKFYRYYGANPKKMIFMPYATDNDWFIEQSKNVNTGAIEKSLNITDKTVVLYSGKLIERKRPLDLVKAYEIAKKKFENIVLIFIGDGILRNDIIAYIKEKDIADVHLVGFKNIPELPIYYSLADIFVIPSFNEVWGMVVNEAMCFGLPIISSDSVGAAPDLVSEGVNGYLYPCGSVEELAKRLISLIQDGGLRERMGQQSLKIIGKYSAENDACAIMSAISMLR